MQGWLDGGVVTFLLTCIIPGTPQQQGSKRSLGAGRPFIEANRNLAPWRADAIAYLQAEWRGRGPITEPVSLDVAFDFARPASHYGTGRNAGVLKDSAPSAKATAPDLDKLCRALGDALTQSGVLRDDALIVEWVARKQWARKPDAWLRITSAN